MQSCTAPSPSAERNPVAHLPEKQADADPRRLDGANLDQFGGRSADRPGAIARKAIRCAVPSPQRFPARILMATTDSLPQTDLGRRAREVIKAELATYALRTVRSQAATDRARRSLPLGVPSSFQAYDPYPIVARRAQ